MRWEDPPEPARGAITPAVAWETEATELRSRPGEWGRLKTYPAEKSNAAYSMVRRVNTGELWAFRPAGLFKATARTAGSECVVYARYLGE